MTAAGPRRRQASNRISAGSRHLVAQRVGGRVAVIDEPADHDAPVCLVEPHVESLEELHGLRAANVAHSQASGRPAIVASRELVDTLCEESA